MADQPHQPHRPSKEKKQRPAGQQNPKAFAFANPGRLQRQGARSHDIKEKRLHVPLVDRLPEEAPPLVVAVVGPPQVGKTTLIKSLIRRYTKQTLSVPTGPITVVTSKRRRLTFIETPSDSLASMIDIAKVVDIVLLMIDGKYGFEMETMEFLNVLSASGMPGNVFGILTKLDLFKKQDTLRAQKKRLKHRFWSELYQGAKLFYLSGVVNGRYPDREVLNLSRFLSVMKNPRPLVWRNSHPYCLADRFEDMTAPQDIEKNPKCDRTVALYGYLRGTNFPAQGGRVHIPGLGDLDVANIEARPDPCPTPFQKLSLEKQTGKSTRRRLDEKQKIIYAPMSDVGGVLVDRDRVYIDLKKPTFDPDAEINEERGLGEQLVMSLQGDRRLLGQGAGDVRLFGDDAPRERRPAGEGAEYPAFDGEDISDEEEELANGEESDVDEVSDAELDEVNGHNGTQKRIGATKYQDSDEDANAEDLAFADSDSDIGSLSSADEGAEDMDDDEDDEDDFDDEDSDAPNWKNNLADRASAAHTNKLVKRTVDLAKLMYDLTLSPFQAIQKWKGAEPEQTNGHVNGDNEDDDFFKSRKGNDDDVDAEERMVAQYDYEELESKWQDPENAEALRKRFAIPRARKGTGDGDEEFDDEDDEDDEDGSEGSSDSGEGDGEFEDMETGELNTGTDGANNHNNNNNNNNNKTTTSLDAERQKNARRKEELKLRFEAEDRDGFLNDKTGTKQGGAGGAQEEEEFNEDQWYDLQKAKIQKQLDINRAEFEQMDEGSRVRVEGYKAGTYARIVLSNVHFEFSNFFNPRTPLIVGGLSTTEDRFGFVQVRIKRHRWHTKILKTNDPLIFSMGWRRFQTLPVYSISDSRTRNRMLKYTPEHMHCFGSFYGPLIAPNSGFCCVQSFSNKNSGFRIAATGVVLSVDENTEIVKKLKLKGYPHKVYKNTAIIKDMFGSDLEIAKFKAGNLRTVSGIRGMIKGRAGKQYPEGYVRAGFEDKILMSDIVFLSTWRFVKPREFYMPVTNLLLPHKPGALNKGVFILGEKKDTTTDHAANITDADWTGMRLTGQLRRDLSIPTPQIKDSSYAPITRTTRHFNPLRVPRKLQAELPFKSQIATMKPQQKETYLQKRAVVLGGEEKRTRDLMQKLTTLRNEKVAKREVAQEKRKEGYRAKVAENLEKKEAREKRERKEYWGKEGRKRKADEGENGGGGGGGRSSGKYAKKRKA